MSNFQNIKIEKVTADNYGRTKEIFDYSQWGSILLPSAFTNELWGGVVLEDTEVLGGWIGTLRGNKPIVGLLAKSVYFDAYPVFVSESVEKECLSLLIDTMRDWAYKEGIVMFNLTHWVRGLQLPYLNVHHNATFLLPLQETSEAQWNLLERTQRNKVRKGEKNGVVMEALTKDAAIEKLPILQQLRAQTQQHAIGQNANASMLLKSEQFFANIIHHTDSTLFIGSVEGKPATVALMIVSGSTAYYYSGGSDYELNRQTGSSAFVVWNAIEYYRKRDGVKYFDMGGVPANPDSNHPAFGVYTFKKSFGGEYMEFDAGEIPINKWKYAILKFALSQRKLLRLFSKVF